MKHIPEHGVFKTQDTSQPLKKIPHEHETKITCDHTCSHVITCDFGTCTCGIQNETIKKLIFRL